MPESDFRHSRNSDLRHGLEGLMAGRFDDAERAFGLAIDKKPKSAKVWLLRGMARARLGRGSEAREDVRRALSLSPNDPELLKQAALVLRTGNHPIDGLRCLERAAAHTPGDAVLHERLFVELMKLGWYKEAITAINVAIEHTREPAPLVHRAAVALFRDLSDPQAAMEYLERHFPSGSGIPSVWFLRADTLGALGRFAEGLAAVTEALEIAEPGSGGHASRPSTGSQPPRT